MISEIPVTQEPEPVEPLEPAEPAEPLEPPPPASEMRGQSPHPSPPQKEPEVKRRPGRPKKEKPAEASEARVPKAQPKPKTKPKVKDEPFKATLQEAQTAPSFSIGDLSNGQLMAELVNRRRATDREMKASLYRSFVM